MFSIVTTQHGRSLFFERPQVDEEVILGWEWDDGNAVHSLSALFQTPSHLPVSSRMFAIRLMK